MSTQATTEPTATLKDVLTQQQPSHEWVSSDSITDFYREWIRLWRINVYPDGITHRYCKLLKGRIPLRYWGEIVDHCWMVLGLNDMPTPAWLISIANTIQYNDERVKEVSDGEGDS